MCNINSLYDYILYLKNESKLIKVVFYFIWPELEHVPNRLYHIGYSMIDNPV